MSKPATVAKRDASNTPDACRSDSTSERQDLSIPAGLARVTATLSARGNMPLRYPGHPDHDEDLHYEDWCAREVARLRRQGRTAAVVYGERNGLRVCCVAANPLHIMEDDDD